MRITCFVALAASAAVAPAQISLIEETRLFELSAQGESDLGGGQNTFFGFGSSSNDDPLVPWIVSDSVFTNDAQSAIASAWGDFLMDINDDSFYFSGSLNVSTSILDETGQNASANANAFMQITFSIDTQSLWRLTGDGTGTMLMALEDTPGSFIFSNTTTGIDQTYLLGPGEYTLHFRSTTSLSTFGIGTTTDASSLSAAFVLVPATSAGLITLVGLIPLTRRRR